MLQRRNVLAYEPPAAQYLTATVPPQQQKI